ncbi:uncharacterized protein J7T54_005846 [Emericellopsis cladophorae]|uniref:WSC domain-containing protein n=1 Tax=Emericellopsis cladophorae TaxID=2686198 RepID=A0A9P9XWA3_9HYPO|nr:uncharacterized protein J7T54_005846 [Emericellopsis cladophorae]KAI6778743.1 hypothetical protein J7T54_005846 [Emericellopsis cladophorae]
MTTGQTTPTETDDGNNTTPGTATQTDDSETGTTDTETAAPTETGDNPSTVGNFRLLGCYSSDEGFPGFSAEVTNDDMDLDICAEECDGENYFGVYRNQCFCGTDLEGMMSTDIDSCDIACPGDGSEFCGGDITPNRRLLRRQDISNNILLSVYVAIGFVPDGEDTTVTTTFVSTVTGDAGPVATTVTTAVVCSGGICGGGPSGPVFIFNIFTCQECAGEEVYFANPCSCVGGVEYVPHVCDATSCAGKTVYKPEEKPFGGSSQMYYPTPCNHADCSTGSTTMFKPFREGQADYTVPISPAGSGDNGKGPNDGGVKSGDGGSKGNGGGSKGNGGGPGSGNGDAGTGSDNGVVGAGGPGKDGEPVLVSLGDKQMVTTLALVILFPVAGALAGWF